MARQIIKQPNGKFAEFSSIVDAFVIVDATPDEIIQKARQEAADDAERRCRDAIERADKGEIRKPFGLTWEEAVTMHNEHTDPDDHIESNDQS